MPQDRLGGTKTLRVAGMYKVDRVGPGGRWVWRGFTGRLQGGCGEQASTWEMSRPVSCSRPHGELELVCMEPGRPLVA